MRIGIDFDNTIVSYDKLFYKVALEKSLIPIELPQNKVAIRNYLRKVKQENQWTLMQGEVYGPKLKEAIPYPGFIEFTTQAYALGHELYIVSHRTKFPFMGPAYDLHDSAKSWVMSTLVAPDGSPYFQLKNIFYELTKEEKISQICQLNCDVFIDDLPEILCMDGFSKNAKRILFDPEHSHSDNNNLYCRISSWAEISKSLLA